MLRVMSALECPCQSKGGGVLHDSSCWLHGFIGRRGGEVPLLREKKKNQEEFQKNGFQSMISLRVVPRGSLPINRDMTSPTGMHMQAGLFPPHSQWAPLLHAVPQHLIGCDEHDADDECHGEGADEALPHARLTVLL